jgi:toxin YoeB
MKLTFTPHAWADYVVWQETDKKMLKRINQLIKDVQRSPFEGIGKPEPLKHEWSGCWSRRIDDTHRLVYSVSNDGVVIVAVRDHYKK